MLSTTCNKFLGHIRDDAFAGRRLAEYLLHPPAHNVFGKKKP